MRMVSILAIVCSVTLVAGCSLFGGNASPTPSGSVPAPSAAAGQKVEGEQAVPYEIQVVAEQLNVPWDMAFAPDGRLFVTERPGVIRVVDNGKLAEQPVFTLPSPFISRGESGLLGIALDPDFANNRYMYVYHSYDDNGSIKNRVLRLVEQDNQARIDKVIVDGLPGQRNHDGGRIRIGPDGKLYVTIGDAQTPMWSQDNSNLAGKILRMELDGTVPHDNPFPGSLIYSLGHRNPQGLAWHPASGALFSSEHGQSAKDEINLIEAGANYGWPLIEGDESEPKDRGAYGREPLRKPLLHSGSTTWAPSGMTFVTRGPWTGNLLVANLRGEQLLRIVLDADHRSVSQVEPLFKNEYGRIRNVVEGPDGSLYLMTNNRDGRGDAAKEDDKLIRLKPN